MMNRVERAYLIAFTAAALFLSGVVVYLTDNTYQKMLIMTFEGVMLVWALAYMKSVMDEGV